MKKFLSLLVVLFSASVFAQLPNIQLPDIVALVNDKPITRYDFETRKNLIIALANVNNSDSATDTKLNRDTLDSLIEEELLNQHAEKVGGSITEAQLDFAIANIERDNNMQKGGINDYLKDKGVDVESFRKQIKAELLRSGVINAVSESISITQFELDNALTTTENKDFAVSGWIITAHKHDDKYLQQMKSLKNNNIDCNNINEKLYKHFADGEQFDSRLTKMSKTIQSVIVDTKVFSSSSVFEENDKFKMIFLCKKDPAISDSEMMKLNTFLSNKKMSIKAKKFLKNLRAKAYVKFMIPYKIDQNR